MSVRVVARIRPILDKELDKDTIVSAERGPDGKVSIVRIPNPKEENKDYSFTFNGVYDMETTQEELFTNEVAPNIKALFSGLDIMIFAYGVTGTGKTHTMRGGLKLQDRGIIPRMLSAIYRRGKKVTKDSSGETTVTVTMSYYEIYNDKIYDLFEPPEKRSLAGLPLREYAGKAVAVGLTERNCNDLKDFEALYIEANNNRSTAGTKLNAQSSRSHAILMVKVTQTNGEEQLISTASAIDLAGSEDNRRTDNNKERLVESASINRSLFVLSSCIDAIARGDKRIPFRDSKMTRILSLGQNNGITIMILNLSPLKSSHLDTLSSLNVSSRAKRIEVREIENEVVFTQPPRKTAPLTGASIQRQPLRPLANAHNTHVNAGTQKGDKPAKAFSVYSDKSKPSGPRQISTVSQTVRRADSTSKRASDTGNSVRPTKMARPNPTGVRTTAGMSPSNIEAMIERKVQEALANRAMEQPAVSTSNEISEAVQRRLEALEKRIEGGEAEDERTEGLRFLLMAKQHKEHGEDVSALKMYELALPFFPGQTRLEKKIDLLKTKIAAKRDGLVEAAVHSELAVQRILTIAPIPQLPARIQSLDAPAEPEEGPLSKARKARISTQSDADFNGSAIFQADGYSDDDSFSYKTSKSKKQKKTTAKSALRIFTDNVGGDDQGPLSPTTRQLLEIVNSRDIKLIQSLKGVGTKKANDLVEFLELQNEDDGGNIRTLQQLEAVPGLGKATVEKAYKGISALLV